MAGPTMKPSPKAMPIRAKPLERFSLEVVSAIAAVATDRFPPIAPLMMRESTKTQNAAPKNQSR